MMSKRFRCGFSDMKRNLQQKIQKLGQGNLILLLAKEGNFLILSLICQDDDINRKWDSDEDEPMLALKYEILGLNYL